MATENNQDTNKADGYNQILIRPIVSEKSARKEQDGKYTFEVSPDATKIDIKNAIKDNYSVKPKKVNTMNFQGKKKRFRFHEGETKDWKKAIVTLHEGETINIHEEV
ncbi:MAG: 50S ribosomal protein L23 [Candidatus Magasanikbacteria bacterium]